MVTLVIINNPFNISTREIKRFECDNKTTLQDIVNDFNVKYEGVKVNVQLNGEFVVDDRYIVLSDGDSVVISVAIEGGDGGKNPLMLIASIALTVVAFGVGGLLTNTGTWGAVGVTTGWTTASYIAATAVMFLGGQLISKMGPKPDLGKYDQYSDPTYSWSGVSTMDGQGNPIPITYGKVRSGGQSIVKFITLKDDKQYLNWLISAGEGPLQITEIMINDNPVENYTDILLDTRNGTNNQAVIDNFNDSIYSKTLSYELNEKERIDRSYGNAAEGLIIDVEFPGGLYYTNDDGSLGNAWVQLEGKYRKVDTTDWKPFVLDQPFIPNNFLGIELVGEAAAKTYLASASKEYVQIDDWISYGSGTVTLGPFRVNTDTFKRGLRAGFWTMYVSKSFNVVNNGTTIAAKSSAVRRQFRVDGLEIGEYEVSLKVVARSHDVNLTRASTRVIWSSISSVVYDDFEYPNIALIGLKALATEQISGSPTIKFLKERAFVLVYDPVAGYVQKSATNPAWAAYDLMHGASLLTTVDEQEVYEVLGVHADLLMYDKFAEWAQFCDEKKLLINIELTRAGDFWSTVNQQIAPVGRGRVVQFGTRYGAVWDSARDPVQMFTMGNIVAGSFKEEFLSIENRANSVELTYSNKEKNYERDVVTIFGPGYNDADTVVNPTQITMDGVVDYEQAYREGMYQLMSNNLLIRTVTFKASIDAIACTVGDVILVSHDVPQWGWSGRIEQVIGNNTLVLPLTPEIKPGEQYAVRVRTLQDTIYEYRVATIENNIVTIVNTFNQDDLPAEFDIFDFGRVELGSKPFVVKGISRTQDFEREITCLEYNENVFNEDYSIPLPEYSELPRGEAINVINLSVGQTTWVDRAGVRNSRLQISYSLPPNAYAEKFIILVSADGESFVYATEVQGQYAEIAVAVGRSYRVKVITVNKLNQSSGAISKPIETGYDSKPPNVFAIDHELMANGTRRYWWEYSYPDPNDVAGFRIKYIQGNNLNWDIASPLHTGLLTSQPFESLIPRAGNHTIMIKAVDNAGQESEKAAFAVLNMGDMIKGNVLYEVDLSENRWAQLIHDGDIYHDGYIRPREISSFWQSDKAFFWQSDSDSFWRQMFNSLTARAELYALASGQFWLDYDIAGPYTIYYRVLGRAPFWRGDNDAFWQVDSVGFWDDSTDLWKQYSDKVMVNAGGVIQVKIVAQGNTNQAITIKKLSVIIDVPNRLESFDDLTVPEQGIVLPLTTPHPYTTAVRIDAVQQGPDDLILLPEIVSRSPAIIRLKKSSGGYASAIIDVTWQGFSKEVI